MKWHVSAINFHALRTFDPPGSISEKLWERPEIVFILNFLFALGSLTIRISKMHGIRNPADNIKVLDNQLPFFELPNAFLWLFAQNTNFESKDFCDSTVKFLVLKEN